MKLADLVALLRRYAAREPVTREEYLHLARVHHVVAPFLARTLLAQIVGPRPLVRQVAVPTVPKAKRPRCGARCRDGSACRAPAFFDKMRPKAGGGRCRQHGGLSTGPKTAEGRERARAGARKGAAVRWGR